MRNFSIGIGHDSFEERVVQKHNSRFATEGVSCFSESEVLNSSLVYLMKFSAENPRLRQSKKLYGQGYDEKTK